VSVTVDISEQRLRMGMFKIALSLTFLVVILGVIATFIADRFQSIATNSLLLCVAFFFLSNGFLCLLQIIDWFEARKAKSNG
jgi:hypothetical protein